MTRKSYPHHVSLYLSTKQHEQLRALVKRTGVDASKHLRAALASYLEQSQGKRQRSTEKPAPKAQPTGEVLPIVLVWGD